MSIKKLKHNCGPVICKILINSGADINLCSNGISPLIRAIHSKSFDTVKLLINEGVDINYQDSRGWTAIMHACYTYDKRDIDNSCDILELLVDKGADLSVKYNRGWDCGAIILKILYSKNKKSMNILSSFSKNGIDFNKSIEILK